MRTSNNPTWLALPLLGLLLTHCAGPTEDHPVPAESTVEPPTEVVGGVFTTADGTDIVYDLNGGGETTLVFIHCWACNRSFWREQADVFAERYRVLTLDLAGHGASSTDREVWTISGLADDVRALVESLNLDRVILVGHSMGGPIAALAAPRLPERVVGVACVDTLHDVDLPWDAESLAPIVSMYSEDFTTANQQFVPMMSSESADAAIVDWVIENANRSNPGAAIALMSDFPNLDFQQLLSEVAVPIRCVNAAPLGQMIPVTAIENNRRYADFDATTLEGVGHYLMLEKPDEFNELLGAAIEAIDSAN